MDGSLGVVIPAFRPDVDRLSAYVAAIDGGLSPETIRVELDDPEHGVTNRLRDATDGAEAATVVSVSERRRGKGAAITAGFEALSTDVLAFLDADGATPVDSAVRVIEPVRDGTADLAVGSRRHPDSAVGSHQTVFRRALGDAFAWLARRLLETPLYDYQCGAKAITADAWRRLRGDVYESGFAWDIELVALAGAHGARVLEVPIRWEDRPGSTVDPVRDTLGMFRGLLTARHRERIAAGSRLHRMIASDPGPSLPERLHESPGRDPT
ncbi:glycosyltransferase [Halopenitus salinus]|uniref:Glycosyltransferase n=1 Tax=Halopenitus salinus TaxID=1198295 RepID=A0ABD5UNK7_9EURY